MVWAGCLKKLLEVISRQSHMALEVTLSSGNVLLIGVIDLLVIVSLIAASSNCDPLGVTLCPFLVSFGIPLHTFAGCLRQCPSVVDGDHFPSP
jgi:hypothetical protein